MDPKDTTLRLETPVISPGMDLTEETPADVDEPPDSSPQHINFWLPPKPLASNSYAKAVPPAYMRRESLLTRQLHSETEHSDDDEHHVRSPTRGLSMVSTWSNPSTVSTAELTSDDGRSVPSPGISPMLPPTRIVSEALPAANKHLAEPKILGLETVAIKDPVEEGLNRKRCIKFACGNKEKAPVQTSTVEEKASSPPKRKCALKFMCPSKPTDSKPVVAIAPRSPPPKTLRRTSTSPKITKAHRGSDSTVTNPASPRMTRKVLIDSPKPNVKPAPVLDNSDDSGAEATRFHEFATSEDEPDEWTQESTCYRNRLCVTDTLKKENVIRQLGEEVEEEVLAEEDEDDIDEQDDAEEEQEEDEEDEDEDEDEEEDESDDGFHSDDEQGFAGSDDDGEGSDYEWWAPGGLSTAATSTEQLEHLTRISSQPQPSEYPSSLASMSSDNASPHSRRPRPIRTHSKTAAVNIDRPPTPDLPDSTDFVCGTLDEDRPKEQAYINMMKEREAAKHRPVPQDIDPTFPTSDPEMDEEDDEDLEDPEESSGEEIMHGSLDSIHGTARRISPTPRRASIRQRSPAPSAIRHKSPAPSAIRHKSPAPTAIRHRSPAPRQKSPAPKVKPTRFSPPPRARSPAPRKLFGHSPHRARSPAAAGPMTSPPNTRRASPSDIFPVPATGLAGRPNTLTVAASLPKRPGGFLLSRMGHPPSEAEGGETPVNGQRSGRRRGAIDIVKGLEKKKQRRREKLCQKLAAKAAARGEERKKVKPGRGAERMREVGLELQRYKGRAGHILSY